MTQITGFFTDDDIKVNEVKEDKSRLLTLSAQQDKLNLISKAINGLKTDDVVLIRGIPDQDADGIIADIAKQSGLLEQLQLQSGFSSVLGHRQNVSKYLMTVNQRTDYQFIPAHSEGSHKEKMQLAAFYGDQNTTDGGVTVLLNVAQEEQVWSKLREYRIKVKPGLQAPGKQQIEQARTFFKVDLLKDHLTEDDQIVSEIDLKGMPLFRNLAGMRAWHVLSPVQQVYSHFLNRDLYAYWDSIASHDSSSAAGYYDLLKQLSLLKKPAGGMGLKQLDNADDRRVWSSNVNYCDIFKARLSYKLEAGDLLLLNNISWTHSTSNWTPGSGTRTVSAAFA